MNASHLAIFLFSLTSSVLAQPALVAWPTASDPVRAVKCPDGISKIATVDASGCLHFGHPDAFQTIQTPASNPTEARSGYLNNNSNLDCAIANGTDVTVVFDYETANPTIVPIGEPANRILIHGNKVVGGDGNGAALGGRVFGWDALLQSLWASNGVAQEGDGETMFVYNGILITFAPYANMGRGAAYARNIDTGIRVTLWSGQVPWLFPGIHDTCIQDDRLCTTSGPGLEFFDLSTNGSSVTMIPHLSMVGSITGGFHGCWPARAADGRSLFCGRGLNSVYSLYDADTGAPEPFTITVPNNTTDSFVTNFDQTGAPEVISLVNNGPNQPGNLVVDPIEPLTLQANQQVFSNGGTAILTGNDPSAAGKIYFVVTAMGLPSGPGFGFGGLQIPFPAALLFPFAGTTGFFGTASPTGGFTVQMQVPSGFAGLPLSHFALIYCPATGEWRMTNLQWSLLT